MVCPLSLIRKLLEEKVQICETKIQPKEKVPRQDLRKRKKINDDAFAGKEKA